MTRPVVFVLNKLIIFNNYNYIARICNRPSRNNILQFANLFNFHYSFIIGFCEELVNHCASSPCLNGGSCINSLTSYSCACVNAIGSQCQQGLQYITPTHARMHTHERARTRACTYTHVLINTLTQIHTHIHTYKHIHMCKFPRH